MQEEAPHNWKEIYTQLIERIAFLEEENAKLRAENAKLVLELQKLQDKINTNSSNSSKPPSQDPFRKKQKKKSSGKKPGGQPGHKGHSKPVYPKNKLTKEIDIKPTHCPHCHSTHFSETPTSIECRQSIELPEIEVEVTQYNIHTCRCENCHKEVRAEIPKEAQKGFGPRLMGFLTMLSAEAGMSKRKICSIAEHLGIKISLGSICNIHRIAADILKEPCETVRTTVLNEEVMNADETSWKCQTKRYWLWIGTTSSATFFSLDPSRSGDSFEKIYNLFQNTLISDRYGAYNKHEGTKQFCLAHIARDFKKVKERTGVDGALGNILWEELHLVFHLWGTFKEGSIDRKEMQEKAKEHIGNIKDALTVLASANEVRDKSARLASNLLNCFQNLWTFLYKEGVEPTNNAAERGLRIAVVWRKISGGSQSDWGLRFVERVLTVSATLKQRGGNIFHFLTRSFQAYINGTSAPSVFDTS